MGIASLINRCTQSPAPLAAAPAPPTAKLQKEPPILGDDIYPMLGEQGLYGFIRWLTGVFSSKTPELKNMHVIAAMFGTHQVNEDAAKTFWPSVARGGSEFDEQDPAAMLDSFLKNAHECKKKRTLKEVPG
jgi:hypothetical protein